MNDKLKELLLSFAPTVASAVAGPAAGLAVSALAKTFGLDAAAGLDAVSRAVAEGKVTPEALGELRKLELQYQNDEKERGFKYAELAFRDRESARNSNVASGTSKELLVLSTFLLLAGLGTEVAVLFYGYPESIPEIVVGRILGLIDAVVMLILGYHYGSSSSSEHKTHLLSSGK